MGFLLGIFDLLKTIGLLLLKCVEYIFLALIFSFPIHTIYEKMFMIKFNIPNLQYLDFVAIIFVLQMMILLIVVSVTGSRAASDRKNIIVLPDKKEVL